MFGLSAFERNKKLVEKFGKTYSEKQHIEYARLVIEAGSEPWSIQKMMEDATPDLVNVDYDDDYDRTEHVTISEIRECVGFLNRAAQTNMEVNCIYDVEPSLSNGLRIGRFEITNKLKVA